MTELKMKLLAEKIIFTYKDKDLSDDLDVGNEVNAEMAIKVNRGNFYETEWFMVVTEVRRLRHD